MAKHRGPHRVILADFKAKKRDENSIEIIAEDGETYRIEPPDLWPDDVLRLSETGDPIGMGRLLLGDRYDAFVAGGGSASLLASIVQDELGSTVGESSASSSS